MTQRVLLIGVAVAGLAVAGAGMTSVLMDLPHGGFVTVIQSGLATERRKHGVDPLKPVRIVEYANGRLVAEDPETGRTNLRLGFSLTKFPGRAPMPPAARYRRTNG